MVLSKVLAFYLENIKDIPEESHHIALFEAVRNIPYAFVSGAWMTKDASEILLTNNKGTCLPKHLLLSELYRRIGIPTRYYRVPFRWVLQPVAYPDEIKKIAEVLPLSHHLALHAYLNSRWILIDATWDPPLINASFPVNIEWDGRSDTKLAVIPYHGPDAPDHNGKERTDQVRSDSDDKAHVSGTQTHIETKSRKNESKNILKFQLLCNIWFEEIRKKEA